MASGITLRANITTDSSGNATVFLSQAGQASYPLAPIGGPWSVESISYVKNDFASGVDFTITEYETGLSLWTESDVNSATTHEDPTLIMDSQVKIVIANGGNAKTGTLIFKLVSGMPSTIGSGMTALTGDVTASGTGSVSSVVTGLTLTEAPSNQSWTGLVVSLTYGESLTPGAPVYFKSDGAVWKADANGTGTYPCIGIALETASSGSHKVLLHGIYRDDSLFAWTVGGLIYLSTTAGTLTQTQPSATGDVIQIIGIATHADRMYVNPQLDYLTHA